MSTHDTDREDRSAVLAIFTDGLTRSGLPARQAEQTARWLYDRVEHQYQRAGTPYGPTDAGLLKWIARRRITPSA